MNTSIKRSPTAKPQDTNKNLNTYSIADNCGFVKGSERKNNDRNQ